MVCCLAEMWELIVEVAHNSEFNIGSVQESLFAEFKLYSLRLLVVNMLFNNPQTLVFVSTFLGSKIILTVLQLSLLTLSESNLV